MGEVLSHAPHGNPLSFIAGRVLGQDIALKEQPPGHAHKVSIWLADADTHGGQHSHQLHHPSLYVTQVPTLVQAVGCCRRWQADQFILGLPCGQALSQIVKVGYNICKGAFIPLPWDSGWWLASAVSHICFNHLGTGYLQEGIH